MLKLSGINKTYGERQALSDVSFEVDPGRLTGFVGANGAGKTTTMRIILGLLDSDQGTVLYQGVPLRAEVRRSFGYMPEERGLYPKMKVVEQIVYLARLQGIGKREAVSRATALLTNLGLEERLSDTIESLSLGNQQRAQIAAALVHDPRVLILDEPFSGLDPLAVESVAAVLAERAANGVAVLFSSHQLDVVERLCDDVVIIESGVVSVSGSRDSLLRDYAKNRYELITDGDVGWLRDQAGVQVVDFEGGSAIFDVDSIETAKGILDLAANQSGVMRFAQQQVTLARIFKEVIR